MVYIEINDLIAVESCQKEFYYIYKETFITIRYCCGTIQSRFMHGRQK